MILLQPLRIKEFTSRLKTGGADDQRIPQKVQQISAAHGYNRNPTSNLNLIQHRTPVHSDHRPFKSSRSVCNRRGRRVRG